MRATQFFEFAVGIADTSTTDGVVRLPGAGVQPMAAGSPPGTRPGASPRSPARRSSASTSGCAPC
ncbi:hypothetical protein AB0L41_45100 [Amycolatopsis mediterranei]|uniref:hypothetical protein n=1 Tax=Amycolatopsis mediterranei TaxID=33910 RepID=UPI00341E784F